MVEADPSSGGSWVQMTTAVTLAIAVVVLLLLFLFKKAHSRHPPGPMGAPLLGYLPFFDAEVHLTFNALRATYGDVLSLSFGSWPAIVVSGYDIIKEALVTKGDDFSARPAFTTFVMLNGGRDFGVGPFDAAWKTLHGVIISGLGKFLRTKTDFIEDVVRTETSAVVGNFTAHKQEDSFNPKKLITTANFRVMHQLCYGKVENPSQDESLVAEMVGWQDFRDFKRSNPLLDAMPWLRHIQRSSVSRFKDIVRWNEGRRSARVREHESTLAANAPPRDLTDCLIQASNELMAEDLAVGIDKKRATESLDFLVQGNRSSATALHWLVLLMAAYPEVQEKVFKEIDEVVGKGRSPALADRCKMNYVEATIVETLRFASPIPIAIPHSAACDTVLQEFDIKKHTVAFFNLHSIHTDKDLWGDPETFRPERMLTPEGQLDQAKVDMVTAFSMGRRSCTAGSLALAVLFLFFSTLVQHVKLVKPPDGAKYTMEGHYDPTRQPKDFQICVTSRG